MINSEEMGNNQRNYLLTQESRPKSGGDRKLITAQITSSGRTLRSPSAPALRSFPAIISPPSISITFFYEIIIKTNRISILFTIL